MLTGSAFRSSKSPMKPPMRFRRHAQAKIVRVGTGFVEFKTYAASTPPPRHSNDKVT